MLSFTFVINKKAKGVSIFFYTIFLWLYRTGIRIISPWNPKARLWLEGRKNILSRIGALNLPESDRTIWMHCASLGEFEQGRPVIERLKTLFPSSKIVITFFSPSGYEVRKDYKGADHIFYLPADSKRNAKIFINSIRPSLVIWVKYDYWFYYLHELKKKAIPILLISANFRKEQPFFKWYGRLHRYMLDCFNHIFIQTEESKKLLAAIGFTNTVSIGGDTRFDRVIEIAEQISSIPIIDRFCDGKKVIVAGSTWEEDEEELDHYANTHPEIRFIIAPHEIDEPRLKEVESLFHNSIRYSTMTDDSGKTEDQITTARHHGATPNVLIIDNIGMLSRLYKYATITYVGGGFGDDGVHNVLEAAVYKKPVVFGPVIEKYLEAVELVECGGGIVIDSALEAEAVFNRLLEDEKEYNYSSEAAKKYVYGKKGATEIIVRYIQENLRLTS